MGSQIRLNIKGKDGFWEETFFAEWAGEFPKRSLTEDGTGHLLVEPEWLEDIERIAERTSCEVLRAPDNPHRRMWMRSLMRRRWL